MSHLPINPIFTDTKTISAAASAFQNQTEIQLKDLSVPASTPFPLCCISNAFNNDLLLQTRRSLLQQPFHQKSNDLYSFWQSNDLRKTSDPPLSQFRNLIYSSEMIQFVSQVIGHPLSNEVDLAGQQYKPGDYLLCHDDRLEGRKVAFICYLVDDDWHEADGGELELFGNKPNCSPSGNSTPCSFLPNPNENFRFLPRWNRFAFFEVTETSFHQVRENISSNGRVRISITGWYHCSDANSGNRLPKEISTAEHLNPAFWINPTYFNSYSLERISQSFVDNSSIFLSDFLLPDKYSTLKSALSQSVQNEIYIPLKCRYFQLVAAKADKFLMQFREFFKGPAFETFLKTTLLPECVDDCKKVGTGETEDAFHIFKHRCFTLTNDLDATHSDGFDVDFFVMLNDAPSQQKSSASSGSIFYMSKDDPLLEIEPKDNCLSLVYKSKDDGKVFRFVKYLNRFYLREFAVASLTFAN